MAIEVFCDQVIVYSLCASIFVLPASIALLNSFAVLAVFFFFLKKINRIIADWPVKSAHLNLLGRVYSVWKGFAPPVNFLDRPLKFLVLAVFISVVFSQYPSLSFTAFIGKFLKCVFMYFSFIESFKEEKQIRLFLFFFFASAFITVMSGLWQHYTGKDFLKGHIISGENFVPSGRINSTFFGANGFGVYLLPVFGLAIHLLYAAIRRHGSLVLVGVLAFFLVLLLACLCWTYSRSSWIGYLSIIFITILMDRRKALIAGALLLVFIFIFLPSLNNVRHLYLINDNNKGVQVKNSFLNVKSILEQGGSGRFNFWKKAVLIIRSSPIWGTGLNTYTRVLKRKIDPETWWYAHNCYLQMAAEIGIVGLACFLWMLFVLLRHGLSCCNQIKDLWTLSILQGCISGLCGFMVQSFFDNTFFTVQLSMLMWMIFGLMVAVTRLNPMVRHE